MSRVCPLCVRGSRLIGIRILTGRDRSYRRAKRRSVIPGTPSELDSVLNLFCNNKLQSLFQMPRNTPLPGRTSVPARPREPNVDPQTARRATPLSATKEYCCLNQVMTITRITRGENSACRLVRSGMLDYDKWGW